MGNRGVIRINQPGMEQYLYLHWQGGRDSVEGFLEVAKELRLPPNNQGLKALAHIINDVAFEQTEFDWPEKQLTVYIHEGSGEDYDLGDHGIYVVDLDWNIVGREGRTQEEGYLDGTPYKEQDVYNPEDIKKWVLDTPGEEEYTKPGEKRARIEEIIPQHIDIKDEAREFRDSEGNYDWGEIAKQIEDWESKNRHSEVAFLLAQLYGKPTEVLLTQELWSNQMVGLPLTDEEIANRKKLTSEWMGLLTKETEESKETPEKDSGLTKADNFKNLFQKLPLILRTYERQEELNEHNENGVLLATLFGTATEQAKMRDILARSEKQGSTSREDMLWRDRHINPYYAILQKLAAESSTQAGATDAPTPEKPAPSSSGGDDGVAETILEQLGGGEFRMMTGARDLVSGIGDHGGLQFKITKGKQGVDKVVIKYDKGLDLYDVEFWNMRTKEPTLLHAQTMVPADDLRPVFYHNTGLITSSGLGGSKPPEKKDAPAVATAPVVPHVDPEAPLYSPANRPQANRMITGYIPEQFVEKDDTGTPIRTHGIKAKEFDEGKAAFLSGEYSDVTGDPNHWREMDPYRKALNTMPVRIQMRKGLNVEQNIALSTKSLHWIAGYRAAEHEAKQQPEGPPEPASPAAEIRNALVSSPTGNPGGGEMAGNMYDNIEGAAGTENPTREQAEAAVLHFLPGMAKHLVTNLVDLYERDRGLNEGDSEGSKPNRYKVVDLTLQMEGVAEEDAVLGATWAKDADTALDEILKETAPELYEAAKNSGQLETMKKDLIAVPVSEDYEPLKGMYGQTQAEGPPELASPASRSRRIKTPPLPKGKAPKKSKATPMAKATRRGSVKSYKDTSTGRTFSRRGKGGMPKSKRFTRI